MMLSAFRWSLFSKAIKPSDETQAANDQSSGEVPLITIGKFQATKSDSDVEIEKWPDTVAAEIIKFDDTVRASLE
jgi:hypothetical protein